MDTKEGFTTILRVNGGILSTMGGGGGQDDANSVRLLQEAAVAFARSLVGLVRGRVRVSVLSIVEDDPSDLRDDGQDGKVARNQTKRVIVLADQADKVED